MNYSITEKRYRVYQRGYATIAKKLGRSETAIINRARLTRISQQIRAIGGPDAFIASLDEAEEDEVDEEDEEEEE